VQLFGDRVKSQIVFDNLDFAGKDYSLTAWLRTTEGGTILSKTDDNGLWKSTRNAKSLFVHGRHGKATFAVGASGMMGAAQQGTAVESAQGISDGKWHHVALVFLAKNTSARVFVDG
jgi:hypothetical protein